MSSLTIQGRTGFLLFVAFHCSNLYYKHLFFIFTGDIQTDGPGPSTRKSVTKATDQGAATRAKKLSTSSSTQLSSPFAFKVKSTHSEKNGIGKQKNLVTMPPIGDNTKAEVQKIIESNDLVVFSKTTCPFCTKVSPSDCIRFKSSSTALPLSHHFFLPHIMHPPQVDLTSQSCILTHQS